MTTNQTFGIATASQNFIDAGATWMEKYFTSVFPAILGIPTKPEPQREIDEAYIEMRCAAAILTWEIRKSGEPLLTQPGALFDDETVDEMLRGTWG